MKRACNVRIELKYCSTSATPAPGTGAGVAAGGWASGAGWVRWRTGREGVVWASAVTALMSRTAAVARITRGERRIGSIWPPIGAESRTTIVSQRVKSRATFTAPPRVPQRIDLVAKEWNWLDATSHTQGSWRMTTEQDLREKLRKIESLFAGAATTGEKAAADAAADRIRARLHIATSGEKAEEIRFSVPDVWSRQLFIALCRRYGISPFRYRRMHRQTVIVKAPRSFVEQVLWPEFGELSGALTAYLAEITEKVIREEVHGETADAEEREEPRQLGR